MIILTIIGNKTAQSVQKKKKMLNKFTHQNLGIFYLFFIEEPKIKAKLQKQLHFLMLLLCFKFSFKEVMPNLVLAWVFSSMQNSIY